MSAGWVFLASLGYLSLAVSVSYTLSKEGFTQNFWTKTLGRWGKFLLGLGFLGIIVEILTLLN
jgi:hypothetical protein